MPRSPTMIAEHKQCICLSDSQPCTYPIFHARSKSLTSVLQQLPIKRKACVGGLDSFQFKVHLTPLGNECSLRQSLCRYMLRIKLKPCTLGKPLRQTPAQDQIFQSAYLAQLLLRIFPKDILLHMWNGTCTKSFL